MVYQKTEDVYFRDDREQMLYKMINPELLTLRPKQDTDFNFLITLYESSREEEFSLIEWRNDEERITFFTQQYNAQQLHFDTNYDNLDYDILVYDNIDIGRLVLHRTPENMHCVDIIIVPEYRKKGIGGIVMEWIRKELDDKSMKATLYFEKTKPHLEHIYSKYGFVTTEDLGTHKFMERAK